MIAVGLFYLQIGVVGIKHKGIDYFSLRFLFLKILVVLDARFFNSWDVNSNHQN